MVSALIPGSSPGACFSKVPQSFRTWKAVALSQFYLNTPSITRSSFHATFFRRIHRSVFRYRFTENGFTGPKSLRDFRETCPWSGTLCCVLEHARHFTLTVPLSTQVYKCVLVNCWGNQKNCGGVTCDGLLCSIPSSGSRNTPSRFMLQKPG